MTSPDHLTALVEAEEFAGGPMTTDAPSQMTKTGKVIVEAKANGNWQADCTQCGAGCGAAGMSAPGDELDTDALDYEDRMLEDFTNAHRDCSLPAEAGEGLPTPPISPAIMPTSMPARAARTATTWVVRGSNGSDLLVLAEWHTTLARADGTELRFYNLVGGDHHRVATVRAGAWHHVVAESALEPKAAA